MCVCARVHILYFPSTARATYLLWIYICRIDVLVLLFSQTEILYMNINLYFIHTKRSFFFLSARFIILFFYSLYFLITVYPKRNRTSDFLSQQRYRYIYRVYVLLNDRARCEIIMRL